LLYTFTVLVKQSPVKNVFDFDQMALVSEPLLAVCLHCRAVHYLGEKDQNDDFTVLYDIDL